ncbi:endo-1,31,4-beta-D-glucanase-like [Heracleum sosnowskyi]|uniref:Endo-1,31,4-beta-D-glucanase-like n=1 Tax=Heracleum sosnowskyi TaxID=360622 RepID=A0AAD8J8S1_9APIA|nr:endo-1,31,4-beta-D-glucanase-like [Heracleum sosnowskyi]
MSGPECCSNPPNLSSTSGSGSVTELAGLKTYVSGSSHSKLAILFVSDVFGYESPNLRKLADKVANAGFYVVVPDFMHGEPYDPNNVEKPISVWAKMHNTDKGFEDAKPVIAALKSQGITTLGAAGFCWGAKVVVELTKSAHIQAAVLLHPSHSITLDDIKEVKVPMAILGAEIDNVAPPQVMRQFGEILVSSKVKSFVKIFPGVAHGWSTRYKDEDEFAVKSAEEAHQDMLDWFLAHIK